MKFKKFKKKINFVKVQRQFYCQAVSVALHNLKTAVKIVVTALHPTSSMLSPKCSLQCTFTLDCGTGYAVRCTS